MHFLMEGARAGGPKQVGNRCFLDTDREPSTLAVGRMGLNAVFWVWVCVKKKQQAIYSFIMKLPLKKHLTSSPYSASFLT